MSLNVMNYGRMCDGSEVFTIYEELISRLPRCGFYIPNDDPSKRRLTHAARGTSRNYVEAINLDGFFYARIHVSLHSAIQTHPEDQCKDSICITLTFRQDITELPPDAAKLICGLGLVNEKEPLEKAA